MPSKKRGGGGKNKYGGVKENTSSFRAKNKGGARQQSSGKRASRKAR
jgi:hypothetical protein